MDELGRIAALTKRFQHPSGDILVSIGDDAAVLRLDGDLVTTVDVAVEGVHFRRGWAGLDRLSRRAIIAAGSDLAAMGAEPRGALVSLVLPDTIGDEDFLAIVNGVAEGAETLPCPIVGGNLSAGAELSITTTVLGVTRGRVLTRRGAHVGDVVYVTGPPGDRALGLEVLLARDAPSGDEAAIALAEAWLAPKARIAEGRALLARASAAIDISDGLVADLGQLCRASGVGARIYVESVPRHPRFEEVASSLGVAPLTCLLGGGDAYELLFTAPPDVDVRDLAVPIGRCIEGDGVEARLDGVAVELGRTGYRHFG
jgi:thiamine-monophosphate kinase